MVGILRSSTPDKDAGRRLVGSNLHWDKVHPTNVHDSAAYSDFMLHVMVNTRMGLEFTHIQCWISIYNAEGSGGEGCKYLMLWQYEWLSIISGNPEGTRYSVSQSTSLPSGICVEVVVVRRFMGAKDLRPPVGK